MQLPIAGSVTQLALLRCVQHMVHRQQPAFERRYMELHRSGREAAAAAQLARFTKHVVAQVRPGLLLCLLADGIFTEECPAGTTAGFGCKCRNAGAAEDLPVLPSRFLFQACALLDGWRG